MEDDYEVVILGLCRLIRRELAKCDTESTAPAKGPDASDYFIKITSARASALKSIREAFENAMTTSESESP